MIAEPSAEFWIGLLLRLSAATLAALVGTHALVCCARTQRVQHLHWQCHFLVLAAILLAEVVGATPIARLAWHRQKLTPLPENVSKTEPIPIVSASITTDQSMSAELRPIAANVNDEYYRPLAWIRTALARNEAPIWWPASVWLLGTGILLGRLAIGIVLLERFRRRTARPASAAVNERASRLANRLGLPGPVRVLFAPRLVSPMAFGTLCPTIVLPEHFETDFPENEQEAMLLHELAHLSARDPAFGVVAEGVIALLWWQPVVWWSWHKLHTSGELAADDASVLGAGGATSLAESLVKLARRLAPARGSAGAFSAADRFRSDLGRRVTRLLSPSLLGSYLIPPCRMRTASIAGSAAVLLLVFTVAVAFPLSLAEGESPMNEPMSPWRRSALGLALAVLIDDPSVAQSPAAALEPATTGFAVVSELQPQPSDTTAAAPGDPELDSRQALQREKDRLNAFRATLLKQIPQSEADAKAQALVREEALEKLRAALDDVEKRLDGMAAQLEAQSPRPGSAGTQRLIPLTPEPSAEPAATPLPKKSDPAMTRSSMPGNLQSSRRGGMNSFGGMGMGGMSGMMGAMGGDMSGLADGTQQEPLQVSVFQLKHRQPEVIHHVIETAVLWKWPIRSRQQGSNRRSEVRSVIDRRTNSIIVRATPEQTRFVRVLIQAIDAPAGVHKTQGAEFNVFQLKHARAAEVGGLLQDLYSNVETAILEQENTVIVFGASELTEEVAAVIGKLDAPSAPAGSAPQNSQPSLEGSNNAFAPATGAAAPALPAPSDQ